MLDLTKAVEAADQELLGFTGECTCHEMYTGRSLHDPDCQFHLMFGAGHDAVHAALPHIIEALRLEADLDAGINMANAFSGGAGTPLDKDAFVRFYEAAHATKWLAARAEKTNDTQVITPL